MRGLWLRARVELWSTDKATWVPMLSTAYGSPCCPEAMMQWGRGLEKPGFELSLPGLKSGGALTTWPSKSWASDLTSLSCFCKLRAIMVPVLGFEER